MKSIVIPESHFAELNSVTKADAIDLVWWLAAKIVESNPSFHSEPSDANATIEYIRDAAEIIITARRAWNYAALKSPKRPG